MKIKTTSTSFGAVLSGNYRQILKKSVDNGLNTRGINKALAYINNACPGRDKIVSLFYNESSNGLLAEHKFLNGVEIHTKTSTLFKNIDISKVKPAHLFYYYAVTVKNLIKGKIKPDTIKNETRDITSLFNGF